MSRRDTIIIAVLVNAALLMILFATAVRSDDPQPGKDKQLQLAEAPAVASPTEEDFLNQFVSAVPTLEEARDEVLSFTEEIDFAFTPPEPIEEKKVVQSSIPKQSFVDVTVKKGDFLEKIAKANNTTVTAIMKANNMNSTQLKIGQVLKVPLTKSKPAKTAPAIEGEYYIVKDGDNPWLIASRNNLRLDDLLRLNGLDEQKARRLRPGDRLRIK